MGRKLELECNFPEWLPASCWCCKFIVVWFLFALFVGVCYQSQDLWRTGHAQWQAEASAGGKYMLHLSYQGNPSSSSFPLNVNYYSCCVPMEREYCRRLQNAVISYILKNVPNLRGSTKWEIPLQKYIFNAVIMNYIIAVQISSSEESLHSFISNNYQKFFHLLELLTMKTHLAVLPPAGFLRFLGWPKRKLIPCYASSQLCKFGRCGLWLWMLKLFMCVLYRRHCLGEAEWNAIGSWHTCSLSLLQSSAVYA